MESSQPPANHDSDDILDRLRADPDGVLVLEFERHRDRLHRMVRLRLDTRLQQRVDPEDVLQEAFLDARQRVGHYLHQPSVSFFIWMRSVVEQTLIVVHRRNLGAQMRDARRDVPLSRFAPATTSASMAGLLIGRLTSPSRAAMRGELIQQLHSALDELSDLDREILSLRHFEELSNAEAAEILSLEAKTASMRYFRALTRLRAILERFPGLLEKGT